MIKYFLIIFIMIISILIIKDKYSIKVVDVDSNLNYIVDYSKLSVLDEPKQESTPYKLLTVDGGQLLLKNKYYGKFKIIRKENYYFDENSDINPFDFVLGWKDMSIVENLNLITITQSNRWYYWSIDSFNEITRDAIEKNSANTHILPLNKNTLDKLNNIKINSNVILVGYLVDILKGDKRWESSTTRNDTGGGACEIFLVTDVKN